MVNSVTTANTPPVKTTKTSIFYINDIHGQTVNMEKLTKASKEFDEFVPSEKIDKLKFSSGDILIGDDKKVNKAANIFLNANDFMATAGGNHEFDTSKKDLVNILKNNNYKILGLNVKIPDDTPENKELNKEITTSYIQEQNGTKYGIVGLFPFDFIHHVTHPEWYKDFKTLSIEETIPLLQEKINEFNEQGVNKVIVLSHAGYNSDVKLANSVEGIDVILGGHSHNLIKDIQEGKNLFYSKKTGEPTIITQAGHDGNHFGVLNLEFNESGVITKAQNNVSETNTFSKFIPLKYVFDKLFGNPGTITHINSVEPQPSNILIAENPNANFIADAIKNELDTDIGIINSANFRGKFEAGDVSLRDISSTSPFKNKMTITEVTEQELVNALKRGAESLTIPNSKPGILQVSGLKYTISKKGEVKNIKFIDKQGKEIPIDVNNPNPFKIYKVAMDSFVTSGGNNYFPNKYDNPEIIKFDFDKDKLTADYLKKLSQPIDIKTDGRIQIVD